MWKDIIEKEFLRGKYLFQPTLEKKRGLIEEMGQDFPAPDLKSIIYCAYHGIQCKKCEVCGKNLPINSFNSGFVKTTCSRKCFGKSPSARNKRKSTIKKRYGTEYYYQSSDFKKKSAETCSRKYGAERYTQTAEYREKFESTCLERYGVLNPFQDESFKQKSITTRIERYGAEYYTQTEEYAKKYTNTCLEKYGVPHYSKTADYPEKVRSTCLERYGVDNYTQTEEYILKSEKSNLEKYGVRNYRQSDECRRRIIETCRDRYGVDWFFQSKEFSLLRQNKLTKPHATIVEFIDYCGIHHINNDRGIIAPLEIDINIPDLNLGIEVNGVYWHSSYDRESDAIWREYHLNKTTLMKESGYRLIHLTDVEINTKPEICLSMIASVIGKTERIAARKCDIITVDSSVARDWFNETHIQGWAPCSIYYGLTYGGELVSVMGLTKSRFDRSYDWELVRFSSRLNTTVVGGFSKILSYFRKHHSGSIVSYADYSRSNGDVYRKNGFEEVGLSKPSYRWVRGGMIFNRHSFMRRNLPNILENFDPNLTEVENCWNHGYRRLWDCGQLKFVLGV